MNENVTPVQQDTVQPTPPKTPSVQTPKGKKPLILMITIHLVAVTVIGYLVYLNMQLKEQISLPQPTPVTSITPTTLPTTDPTVNWKTYNMPSYSVKAPQELQLNKKGDGDFEDLLMLSESIPLGKTPEKGIDITFGYLFGNGIVKCVTNNDCYNYLNTSILGGESAGSKTITTQTSVTISDQVINGFRHLDPPFDTSNLTRVRIIYPLSHNGNLFEISFNAFGNSESEINEYVDSLNINQILSTFKFNQ